MADFAYATFADVQEGYEKPIPGSLTPKVEKFLSRASTRLSVVVKSRTGIELRPKWEAEDDESDLKLFVRDMVSDAAERKFRNPAGFSHENAGIFSISRWEDFAKGRIDFDPEDLALLDGLLESTAKERILGPIRMVVPEYRLP
jgi:hypothetical protein